MTQFICRYFDILNSLTSIISIPKFKLHKSLKIAKLPAIRVTLFILILFISFTIQAKPGLDIIYHAVFYAIDINSQPFSLYVPLAYPEHFRTTNRTYTLSCRLTVLHGNRLRIFHLLLSTAFNTIGLHLITPFLLEG